MRYMVRMVGMMAAVLALSIGAQACAARGARNKTRVAALGVTDAAISLSQAESNLHAANILNDQQHRTLDGPITRSLYAARAFERAARQWPESTKTLPADVDAARLAILAALSDVEKAVPAAANAHDAIVTAIEAVRAAVRLAFPNVQQARFEAGSPIHAEIPLDPAGLIALIQIGIGLVDAGKTTFDRLRSGIRDLLKREGATDEELDAGDARLSSEIKRREDEAAAAASPADPAAPAADSSASQG